MQIFFVFLIILTVQGRCFAMPEPYIKVDVDVNVNFGHGCEMDGVVYRNGAIAEKNCIILKCENGCWVYEHWNQNCSHCYTYNMTNIVPHVSEEYKFPGPQGVYHFSGGYGLSAQPFGIDISFIQKLPGEYCIEHIIYYESGVKIYILPIDGVLQICVEWGSGPCVPFVPVGICTNQPVSTGYGTVYMYLNLYGAYIIGSYGPVYVEHIKGDSCLLNVQTMATPSLKDHIGGLCGRPDVWHTPYPQNDTESNGEVTDDISEFVHSWMIPVSRKRHNKDIKKHLKDHTLQVTDQPIIEKTMSDIVKSCEERNERQCSVLSSEECEILQETCVFRMSNVDIPGQGGSSDSSE